MEVQIRRDDSVMGRQNTLDKAGDPGRPFEVAQVGFHRTDQAALACRPLAPQHRAEREALDGIAHGRAGAVRFDELNGQRIDACVGIDLLQQGNLRNKVGHREPFGQITVLIHPRPAHQCVDHVAIGKGFIQRLQDDHAHAFAADVAVGGCVKCLAELVRIQEPGLGQHDR